MAENNLRFPGQYYDEETGLHYNWHRYYDPAIGRYMTVDPIGFAGGDVNLYGYVGGNVVNGSDPWGLKNCEIEYGKKYAGGAPLRPEVVVDYIGKTQAILNKLAWEAATWYLIPAVKIGKAVLRINMFSPDFFYQERTIVYEIYEQWQDVERVCPADRCSGETRTPLGYRVTGYEKMKISDNTVQVKI